MLKHGNTVQNEPSFIKKAANIPIYAFKIEQVTKYFDKTQ
jgi:hypothetical protein